MSGKKIPLRKCIGCGEMRNKYELIRILHTPEGEIIMDATGRKNGRGAYLCKSCDCLLQAEKSRALERSLKAPIPTEIYEALKKELKGIE